jgi:hypothetical protein
VCLAVWIANATECDGSVTFLILGDGSHFYALCPRA